MGASLVVHDLAWSFAPGNIPFIRIPRVEVPEKSVVVLTGPSGAGKSTLLFLLAGMEHLHSGSVTWGKNDLATMTNDARDAWRRDNVGIVFQDFQLIPSLSALKNVLLPLTFSHFIIPPETRIRAEALLSHLGVPRIHALAGSLSRGEMQRVSIARALMKNPSIILADEPTASLDAGNEDTVSTLLLTAARENGATLVISSHQKKVKDDADYILDISHGQMVSFNERKGGTT
ncbi:ABC transporter ATP-binding protein [Parasphaerochaeta coccoides]|uniref:Phosphonate-transporting ATPase n=1 Tax=Parasphaerochaeta coccoides (strain ATCC BAA-1237 / DSM 17374 / SPN1) TaxID=760011 RepID=F4GJX3_PARC1|nr:ATP-binding cassette domain-containing protein [Parasphaerochaeta coccoides]AEC01398.1 Phosphonate-transporting ATPase [Parasphaerochaeta coccoides DSM 17374]